MDSQVGVLEMNEEKKARIKKGLKELFKWDYHYERGIIVAFVVTMVFTLLFTHSDIPLYYTWLKGDTPYGLLWTWLNPYYWTDMLYRAEMFVVVVVQVLLSWILVRKKRLSKFDFFLGWFTSLIWFRSGVYQNVTVTALGPFAIVFPPLVILMLLQKIPLGWSFPDVTANAHWQCAFNGTQPYSDIYTPGGLQCTAAAVRWNPLYQFFWSYAIVMLWVAYPLISMLWRHRRGIKAWFLKVLVCNCEDCKRC